MTEEKEQPVQGALEDTGEPEITERLLPKFSIGRPVTVAMILLAILVVGFIAYNRIKMDLFPSGLSVPFMGIWVPYRDANPKEIEDQIVKPMEGELKTVKNLRRLFSNSSSNGCWFWMEFVQGTNMDLAYAQVADRVERARPLLPEDQERIYIRRFRADDDPIIYMGISYDETVVDPYYAADKFIKQAVEGIKGVANVELFGLREKYVQIIVDTDKVKTYRVNLPQLMNNLMRENFAMSNGYVYVGKKKYLLRSKSRFSTLEDIKKIEIGNGVRVENIAEVVYDFDEEMRSIMRVDGKIAAGLVAYKESEANTVEVSRLINEKLQEQFNNRAELKGVEFFVFWDQGRVINESIENVKTTMMWGGFFAFFVLLFFLRKMRITLMLTLTIPLSLLISVLMIYALGWTLNSFTMMGLMISIGLVVDNSIVITENIYRFNGLGYSAKRAAILGASEVGLAIILATLTTIVVFLPLMIMGGNSILSFYLTRIGVPVIFAIFGSLVIALILTPLGSTKAIPKKVEIIQFTHSRVTQWYQTTLVKIMKHRLDALIVIVLLIASMAIPAKLIKKSDTSEGGPRDARVICEFPSNYNVDKVDKTMAYLAKKIKEKDEVYHIDHISVRSFKFSGRLEVYLKPNPDTQWYHVIYRKVANLLGLSNYKRMSREELTEDIKKILPVIPGVKMRTTWREEEGASESSLTYVLSGYDIGVLGDLADEIEKQVKLVAGVLAVETDIETGNDEIHIAADREKAFHLGTNPGYLSQLVRFTLGRRKISNFQTPEKEIEIYVKSKPEQRESVAQLRNTFIKTDSGVDTTLASIANLTYHKSVGNIRRENGKSSLELKVFFGDEDMEEMGRRLGKIFKNFKFPTGYSYTKGERARMFEEQLADLQTAVIFSLVLVCLIMGVLFESFALPLSVLVAIPAAFVGSYWFLFLTGTTFEIMAGIGFVVLIGVVVNNAIVLIDLINQYRRGGMQREQAILVAGMHRIRPILMTALTTIFGLLPMALGNTALVGIPYSPMGITLIGGLASSTFLTLFAVPLFYTYFDDLRKFFPRLLRRF
ncbi:MAG: efflux RND transporter permease subunit [Candidatus Aminicenantes bacterium]|nr:efflux RND transporter permease subunit [Candidatus Aminicenantes bacterium]